MLCQWPYRQPIVRRHVASILCASHALALPLESSEAVTLQLRRLDSSLSKGDDGFSVVASSMKACMAHLGPWTIGDLAFGLCATAAKPLLLAVSCMLCNVLFAQRSLRAVAELHNDDLDAVTGSALQDRVQLQSLFEDVAIADAVYEPSAREMAQACRLHQRDILAFEKESEHFQPAFARAVRPEKRQVLLVVRGTQTISDALTNLTGSCTTFQGGQAHEGMLRSAHWLLTHEVPRLSQLLSQHPGFSLRLIGHSLGAGTLSLLAMLLRHDVIPRASLWAFEALREEVALTNWEQNLKDQVAAHRLSKLAQSTADSISEQYRSVVAATTKALASLHLSDHADRLSASASDTWRSITGDSGKSRSAVGGLIQQAKELLEQLPKDRAEKVARMASAETGLSLSSVSEPESAADVPATRGKEDGEGRKNVFTRAPRLYAPGQLLFLCRSDAGSYRIIQAQDPEQRFERIVLNRNMLQDHLCTTYKAALRGMLANLPKE